MIVRSEHIDVLGGQARSAFEERIGHLLNQWFPDSEQFRTDRFRNEVRTQINKSQAYGLETERQIATYVVATFALGTDFDTYFPAAAQVLPSRSLTADEKARWLDNWIRTLFETLGEGS